MHCFIGAKCVKTVFGKLGDSPRPHLYAMECIWLFTPSNLLQDKGLFDATNKYSINITPGRYLKKYTLIKLGSFGH